MTGRPVIVFWHLLISALHVATWLWLLPPMGSHEISCILAWSEGEGCPVRPFACSSCMSVSGPQCVAADPRPHTVVPTDHHHVLTADRHTSLGVSQAWRRLLIE